MRVIHLTGLLLLVTLPARAQQKRAKLVATCAGLHGLAIQHQGERDQWQVSPDSFADDTYVVRVMDNKTAEVDVKSKNTPLKYQAAVLDVQPNFVTVMGVEIQRPVLITIYFNGALAYTQHRWNKFVTKPETKTFMAKCTIEGSL